MGCNLALAFVACAMLATGTLDTCAAKVMYQTEAKNFWGEPEVYDKPWLTTFVMFISESLCLIYYLCFFTYFRCTTPKSDAVADQKDPQIAHDVEAVQKADNKGEEEEKVDSTTSTSTEEEKKDNSESEERKPEDELQAEESYGEKQVSLAFVTREEAMCNPTGGLNWWFPLYATLFASLDTLATSFMGIGLVYCNASIIAILRGVTLVFTLLFAWPILHRKPRQFQITGVVLALIGLGLIGGSTIGADMNSGGDSPAFPVNSLIGIGLTLLGQVLSSIQMVLEEKMLKGRTVPPLFLVGSEGVGGLLVTGCIVLPLVNTIKGSDHGVVENLKNSVYMTTHTPQILTLQIISVFSIAMFNWSSFVYCRASDATARALLNACKTIIIWVVMAIVHYATDARYGESVNYWTFLELAGFVFITLGTLVHNNIARLGDIFSQFMCCCCYHPSDLLDENSDESETSRTEGVAKEL